MPKFFCLIRVLAYNFFVVSGLLHGCGGSDGARDTAQGANVQLEKLGAQQNLGWLGGRARSYLARMKVPDGNGEVSPGGLVLVELDEDAPLARASARIHDILVKVDEQWLPLEENPGHTLFTLLEERASGGKTNVVLGFLRHSKLVSLTVALPTVALEVGLPLSVERFRSAAALGVERLLSFHGQHGLVNGAKEFSECAWTCLALRGAGAGEVDAPAQWRNAMEDHENHLRQFLEDPARPLDPASLACGVLVLAERIGPLPIEVSLQVVPHLRNSAGSANSLSGTLPSGSSIQVQGLEGDIDLEALMADMGDSAQIVTLGSQDLQGFDPEIGEMSFELPDGVELPEGAQVFFHSSGDPLPADLEAALIGAARADISMPSLDSLLGEFDPERESELAALASLLARLSQMQREDGSFAVEAANDAEALTTDALVLLAFGSAERVGWDSSGSSLEGLCKSMVERMNGGKVATAVVQGSDRRIMAARSALVAWAFLVANCPETDPFLKALIDYTTEKGRYLLESKELLGWGSLALAAVRRNQGLADWQSFYDEFRLALIAWQSPTGQYRLPSQQDQAFGDPYWESPIMATALGVILTSMQSGWLRVCIGTAENPYAVALNSSGARVGTGTAQESATGPETRPSSLQDAENSSPVQEMAVPEIQGQDQKH